MFMMLLLALLQDPDVATVTIDVRDKPLGKVLELITKESGVPIELDDAVKKELDLDQELVTFKIEKLQVTGAVKLLLGARGLEVKALDKKKVRVSKP